MPNTTGQIIVPKGWIPAQSELRRHMDELLSNRSTHSQVLVTGRGMRQVRKDAAEEMDIENNKLPAGREVAQRDAEVVSITNGMIHSGRYGLRVTADRHLQCEQPRGWRERAKLQHGSSKIKSNARKNGVLSGL